MKTRVTKYPFSVVENPMYVGSTMIFLGRALGAASPAGFMLAMLVGLIYYATLKYEE